MRFLHAPRQPNSDKSHYQVVQLPNGLTATIISDIPTVQVSDRPVSQLSFVSDIREKLLSDLKLIEMKLINIEDRLEAEVRPDEFKHAAFSLTVACGSFHDPDDVPGLAHVIQHTIMDGHRMSPSDDTLNSFIVNSAGSCESTTEFEFTSFSFECLETKLKRAMEVLADFFKKPKLYKDDLIMGLDAAEMDFQESRLCDVCIKQRIIASTASENNPVSKFTRGCQITMKNITEKRLVEGVENIKNNCTSAHLMKLAIQAALPPETLISWVTEHFSGIPKMEKSEPSFKLKVPFTSGFTNIFYVESLSETVRLDVSWEIPQVESMYRTKPVEYLRYVVSHEGEGSLMSSLKSEFLALSITAGNCLMPPNSACSVFTISILLTELGFENINQVLKLVFGYMKMLRREGLNSQIFRDIQAIAEASFEHKGYQRPLAKVRQISKNMHLYPSIEFLTGGVLLTDNSPDSIKLCLDRMLPNNANIIVSARNMKENFELNETVSVYQTAFRRQEVPPTWYEDWSMTVDGLRSPPVNTFVPDSFNIVYEQIEKVPGYCYLDDLMDVWYKPMKKNHIPYAFIGVHIVTNKVKESTQGYVYSTLYIAAVEMVTAHELYLARAAHYECTFSVEETGLVITVYGYNQHLGSLMDAISRKMLSLDKTLGKQAFDTVKEGLLSKYFNEYLNPWNATVDLSFGMTVKECSTAVEAYETLKETDYDTFMTFAADFFKEAHAQCLIQGNFKKEEAIETCTHFVNKVISSKLNKKKFPKMSVLKLSGDKCIRIRSFARNKITASSVYYQIGECNTKEAAVIDLLVSMMEDALHQKLHVMEQLDCVSCCTRDVFGVIGWVIDVQSHNDKHTPSRVETAISDFVNYFLGEVKNLTNKELKTALKRYINLKTRDLSLKDEALKNWREITSFEYAFDRVGKEVKSILDLNKKTLNALVKKHLETQKKLTVQVVGQSEPDGSAKQSKTNLSKVSREFNYDLVVNVPTHEHFITDLSSFKNTLKPYPQSKFNRMRSLATNNNLIRSFL